MIPDELAELQNPDNWDFDNAVEVKPRRKARAIVSVAFPSADFERVCKAAEKVGTKVSQYIRHAAMQKATPSVHRQGDNVTSSTIPQRLEVWWAA